MRNSQQHDGLNAHGFRGPSRKEAIFSTLNAARRSMLPALQSAVPSLSHSPFP